jgi:hypothetical protein
MSPCRQEAGLEYFDTGEAKMWRGASKMIDAVRRRRNFVLAGGPARFDSPTVADLDSIGPVEIQQDRGELPC